MSKLSETLKEYMLEQGYSETSLADATGILNTSISNFLLDVNLPSYDALIRLLYLFNCSADYLLGLKDIPTEEPLHPVLPFGERLRALMKKHKVTQKKLKDEAKISTSVLYKWLSGKNNPSVESLIRLAEYFDCSVDFLIGRVR